MGDDVSNDYQQFILNDYDIISVMIHTYFFIQVRWVLK
jgi:hypothetical protein